MALGSVTAFSMPMHPTYMWVVPMFHCNGWGNPTRLQPSSHKCMP